jgi:hypothetical protein
MDKKRIAIFVSNYSLGNSPIIINFLEYLSKHYDIDLFLKEVSYTNIPLLCSGNNIRIISGNGYLFLKLLQIRFKFKNNKYFQYFTFNPEGFVLCKTIFPKSKPIYYTLELYLKNDHYGLIYPENLMKKERAEINTISGLIIQSKERDELFREDYNLDKEIPTFYLPATYSQPPVMEKSNYLRSKYNIKDNYKIAIHLGGIAEWFSCTELSLAFSGIENWVLFFQGIPAKEYCANMKSIIEENKIHNVIISEEIFDSFTELDSIISSCEIGIAWYNDYSSNLRTAGNRSSHKIAAYLRFGLPVIAKQYSSTIESIEKKKVGICVNSFDEIKFAVKQIENNYAEFSKNALDEYVQTYYFTKYEGPLLDFINDSVK